MSRYCPSMFKSITNFEQHRLLSTNMRIVLSDDSSNADFASHLLDIRNGRVLSYENIIEVRKKLGVQVNNINELIEKV